MPKGRKDGRISRASETTLLPKPTFNISQLQQSFHQRGLSLDDLVALLGQHNKCSRVNLSLNLQLIRLYILAGAHTLGFTHCSSFMNRIYNFNATHDIDPTLRRSFAASLKGRCPLKNRPKNAGISNDPSPTTFDNTHFRLILQKKSLLSSDHALLTTPQTKRLVYRFATSKAAFHKAFAKSMIKMSSLTGGQEVRKDCRVVN